MQAPRLTTSPLPMTSPQIQHPWLPQAPPNSPTGAYRCLPQQPNGLAVAPSVQLAQPYAALLLAPDARFATWPQQAAAQNSAQVYCGVPEQWAQTQSQATGLPLNPAPGQHLQQKRKMSQSEEDFAAHDPHDLDTGHKKPRCT